MNGGGGHHAAAVGVNGAVMVLILKSSMRGIRGWFYFFSTTLGSPSSILVMFRGQLYGTLIQRDDMKTLLHAHRFWVKMSCRTTKTTAVITIFCRYNHTFLVQGNRDQVKPAVISENPV